MYCTKCGTPIEPGARFCTSCGCSVSETIPEKIANPETRQLETCKNETAMKKQFPVAGLLVALAMIAIIVLIAVCSKLPESNPLEPSSTEDTARQNATPPRQEEYDNVLVSGDGYYLVEKWFENYQEAYMEYGILREDGIWQMPLAADNALADAVNGFDSYAESYYDLSFDYVNEGMFIVRRQCCIFPESVDYWNYAESYIAHGGCYVLNAETCEIYPAGSFITKFFDGYCFYLASRQGKIIRLDRNGNEIEFTRDGKLPWGEPAEGLIDINQKFYDIETAKVVIDLSEYNMVDEKNMKFENGLYTFIFKNPAGTKFCGTMDRNGNFYEEPQMMG